MIAVRYANFTNHWVRAVFSVVLFAAVAATSAHAASQQSAPSGVSLLSEKGSSFAIIYSNPVPGKEQEYHAWYARHIRDIMKIPGFVRVQKFELNPGIGRADPPYRYMLVYELQGDARKVYSQLTVAVAAGKLESPDRSLIKDITSAVFTAIGIDAEGRSDLSK
jgi:hypothetical protein